MNEQKLTFRNGQFKIMQIADVQERLNVSPDTIRLITLALKKEKPDIVVFTGDQIYGLMPEFIRGNTEQKVRNTLNRILSPLEELGIPFAVTFGNHDCQCGISNAVQASFYAEYPNYISGECRSEDDRGTAIIPVYGENGEQAINIVLFDSNTQTSDGEYLPVSKEQLEWYKSKCNEEKVKSGSLFPQFVFQHIPVPEYYDVIKKVKFGTHGAVESFRVRKNQFWVLPEKIKSAGGFMLESPAVPDKNSGEFDVLKATGAVVSLSVGHDHNNSFVAEKDGIKLIYTQCAGFNVYGPKLLRGVRVFNINENSPRDFETHTVTYNELTDEKLSKPLKEFVLTHIPTSMEQVKRLAGIALAGGIVSGTTAMIIYRKKR